MPQTLWVQNSQPCMSWPAHQAGSAQQGDQVTCTFYREGLLPVEYRTRLTSGREIYLRRDIRQKLGIKL